MEEKTTISKNELNDLYNKLQLKDKMIELILTAEAEANKSIASYSNLYQAYKRKALAELSNNEL